MAYITINQESGRLAVSAHRLDLAELARNYGVTSRHGSYLLVTGGLDAILSLHFHTPEDIVAFGEKIVEAGLALRGMPAPECAAADRLTESPAAVRGTPPEAGVANPRPLRG